MRIAFVLLAGLLSLAAQAAPSPQATLDRTLWPEQLDSPALFDVASRAEILSFAQVLQESEMLDEPALAARLQLRQINLAVIRAVRARMWQRLWENYQQAQRSCEQDASFCYPLESMAELRTLAATFTSGVGEFYTGWLEPSRAFHTVTDEQLRKAALFPQTSSEVERLSDSERTGDELNDRVFLLTFVGGPTPAGGATDELADYLRRQKLGGLFFVLGNRLQQRALWGALYRAMRGHPGLGVPLPCPMAGLAGFAAPGPGPGPVRPAGAVCAVVPPAVRAASCRWRGIHGQPEASGFAVGDRRRDDSALSAEASAHRVLTLMLLWRKGVIQFHDNLPKAQTALDWLLRNTAQSGIGWEDCRDYGQRDGA